MLKIAILLINDSIVNTLINCVLAVISQGGNLFLNMIICIILVENALKLYRTVVDNVLEFGMSLYLSLFLIYIISLLHRRFIRRLE